MPDSFEVRSGQSKFELSRSAIAVAILVIVLATFAVYFNTLSNGFAHDDEYQILNNPWIRDFGNLPAVFSHDVWGFNRAFGFGSSNYYRPLMHVVYMITYHLVKFKAWGFHLVNIMLHAGTSILVFLTGMEIFRKEQTKEIPLYFYPPFLVAIVFAIHPIHTEAVSWVAGVPDICFSLCVLLSFYWYIRAPHDGETLDKGRLALSLLFFFCATLFKETALVLPGILVAYDFSYRRERISVGKLLKRYIPYLVVIAIYFGMRIYALGNIIGSKEFREISGYQWVINLFPLFMKYISIFIFPVNLSVLHDVEIYKSIFSANLILSILATLAIVGFVFASLRKTRLIFFGFCFFLIPLLPAFLIRSIPYPFAERYLYLPSFGLLLLFAALLGRVADRQRWRALLAVPVITVILIYSVGTILRNPVWKDSYTLWSDAVAKAPNVADAHFNLGATLKARGRVREAIRQYEIAVSLDSSKPWMHRSLGSSYADVGRRDKAIEQYLIALKIDPDDAKTHNDLGSVYGEMGRYDQAIKQFRAAVTLDPDDPVDRTNLGLALMYVGALDEAIEQLRAAVRLKPGDVAFQRRLSEAIKRKADASSRIIGNPAPGSSVLTTR
jgi:tetratricopeptide (TPR) repeat protein